MNGNITVLIDKKWTRKNKGPKQLCPAIMAQAVPSQALVYWREAQTRRQFHYPQTLRLKEDKSVSSGYSHSCVAFPATNATGTSLPGPWTLNISLVSALGR